MGVLVASTVAPYKFDAGPEESDSWLTHAEAWAARGHDFFLAMERGWDAPHGSWPDAAYNTVNVLEGVGGEIWQFKLNTHEVELTSGGRLVRICTGRNLAHEMFNRHPGRWEAILFLDTDVEPPEDAPERLLEVDHQLVGFNVPTYCLDGPRVEPEADTPKSLPSFHWRWQEDPATVWRWMDRPFPEGADVRMHWNTAGALMVRDHAARHLRWRYDLSRGQTDDPCFQEDAVRAGYGQTWVRHDVVGRHHPETIAPLEARGLDLRL